jgi:hypothetical protein
MELKKSVVWSDARGELEDAMFCWCRVFVDDCQIQLSVV